MVSLGIAGASAFSLPKSVGAIFGLIFASPDPLCLDDLIDRLGISKGSGSNGLKFLQRVGAVKPVYLPGERRTHYAPELSLRRFIIGILHENVIPHLQQSAEGIPRLEENLKSHSDERSLDEEAVETLEQRLKLLKTWNKKSKLILPIFEKVLSKPLSDKT